MALIRRLKWVVALGLGLVALILIGFMILDYVNPLPFDALAKPYSTLIYDQNGKLLRGFLSSDDKWRLPVEVDNVTPEFEKILLAYEDRWFYWHPGVNPGALLRALIQNIREGRIVSGGSTITMQVAHLLEPKERTFANKCKEILRAIQLEVHFTKREILQMYYNLAPFGGNIEGVRAAALLYFGKSPDELTTGEAALLAALPNSPERLRPDRYPDRALAARNKVLARALQFGAITEEQYRSAIAEKIPTSRRVLPFEAPHLTRQVYRRVFSGQTSIVTTIDLDLQHRLQRLLRQHVEAQGRRGVANGAVVVLDNKTHTVLAYIGSLDFFSDDIIGEIDRIVEPRSTGAMLQPFVYVLAIDEGAITPKMYVEDVPMLLGDYVPKNYSRTFSGLVRADYALVQSLNVPAAELLYRLGQNRFYNWLRKAEISTLSDENEYGLEIVSGKAELNLLELTGLYSILATGGKLWRPIYVSGISQKPIQLMSEQAAYLVTKALTHSGRPDLPEEGHNTTWPVIAWKTATSLDYRDVFSVGYNPDYTVGVWIGNFSGRGSAALAGAETATALLFEIFAVLSEGEAKPAWFSIPAGVKERKVCALSGQLPGPYCDQVISDLYIPGVSPEQTCQLHQVVWVNADGEYALGSGPIGDDFRIIKYVKWPERTAAWLEAGGEIVLSLFSSREAAVLPDSSTAGPRIVSPVENQVYKMKGNTPMEYQTIALDVEGADTAVLYWFIDGELVGTSPPGQKIFYAPSPGRHVVVCRDDQGRSAKVEFTVER